MTEEKEIKIDYSACVQIPMTSIVEIVASVHERDIERIPEEDREKYARNKLAMMLGHEIINKYEKYVHYRKDCYDERWGFSWNGILKIIMPEEKK